MSEEAKFIKSDHFERKFNPYPMLNEIKPTFTPEEADLIIQLLEIKSKSSRDWEKYRNIIANIQETDGYLRYKGLI